LGHNYDLYAFDHRVHPDNEVKEDAGYEKGDGPAALDDHVGKIDDTGISVWLDCNGDLQTDYQYKVDAWEEMKATWARQMSDFQLKNPYWLSVDLEGKCLKSAVFSRIHYWTVSDPGAYACRACANNKVICVGERGGRLEALPLPDEAIPEVHTIKQVYVTERNKNSKAVIYRSLWPHD
jgi:hypothetical protein